MFGQTREPYREPWRPLNVFFSFDRPSLCTCRRSILLLVRFTFVAVGTLLSFDGCDNIASTQPEDRIVPLFYPENGHSVHPVSIVSVDP